MKKLTIAFAGAVLGSLMFAPSAGAVETSAAVEGQADHNCGHVTRSIYTNDRSLYNHCGDGWVKIVVQNVIFQTREKCVGPGITDIERYVNDWLTRDSWYVGGC